jgi:hypothetical protein
MENEIWKNIIGYEGIYQISNLGRAKRLSGYGRQYNRFLSPCEYKKSHHLYVTLMANGVKIRKNIHTLVLESFMGQRPSNKHVCRHIDGNPYNNKLSNLLWGTRSENSQDSVRHGVHPFTKLSKLDIPKIRFLLSQNINCVKIANKFNVNRKTISDIKNKRTWTHVI